MLFRSSIPAAFEAATAGDYQVESRARRILRDRCCHNRIQDRLTKIVPALFSSSLADTELDCQDAVGSLWDGQGTIPGGMQYGRDDS